MYLVGSFLGRQCQSAGVQVKRITERCSVVGSCRVCRGLEGVWLEEMVQDEELIFPKVYSRSVRCDPISVTILN